MGSLYNLTEEQGGDILNRNLLRVHEELKKKNLEGGMFEEKQIGLEAYFSWNADGDLKKRYSMSGNTRPLSWYHLKPRNDYKDNRPDGVSADPIGDFYVALDIFILLLRKLQIIHDHEIVHGNINPQSIYLWEFNRRVSVTRKDVPNDVPEPFLGIQRIVYINEFELSRRKGERASVLYSNEEAKTAEGVVYHRWYHPPEFERGLPADYRSNETSDIYNATNLFCLMLTGSLIESHNRFSATTLEQLVEKLGNEFAYGPGFPCEENKKKTIRSIAQLILKGTADDYTQRYQTVPEMLSELSTICKNIPDDRKTIEIFSWVRG